MGLSHESHDGPEGGTHLHEHPTDGHHALKKERALTDRRRSAAVWMLRGPIRFYQLAISPMTPSVCRYYPSCSNYAIEAIDKYGALKGGWLAIRRILRCHPFRPGGFDPVP